jgi:phosphatidylglycerophosphatase A
VPRDPAPVAAAEPLPRWIAVGGGLGYAPLASGTFGSLPGLALAWGLTWIGGWPLLLAGAVVVSVIGMWAADAVASAVGRADPGEVVVDEIAGQMMTLVFLPLTWQTLVLGFLVFRVLDIVKPFPAGRLEALPGGLGIMVDDLVAAAYANLCLQAAAWLSPGVLGVR